MDETHEEEALEATSDATDNAADNATDAVDDAPDAVTDNATDEATDNATDNATDEATEDAADEGTETAGYRLAPGYGAYRIGPDGERDGGDGESDKESEPRPHGRRTRQAVSTGAPSTGGTIAVSALTALVTVALTVLAGGLAVRNGWIGTAAPAPSHTAAAAGADWARVAASVNDSVVSIYVTTTKTSWEGSGAFLDDRGNVVTNDHVVATDGDESIQEITVTTADGTTFEATLVGSDPVVDIAVVRILDVPGDLRTVAFADSDAVSVGDDVMVIGNPNYQSDTVTSGIVSKTDRPTHVDGDVTDYWTNDIQNDAPTNPGNSGGPVFDRHGYVIGIQHAAFSGADSGAYDGLGFAVPSNVAAASCRQIIESGSAEHVRLGAKLKDGTRTLTGSGIQYAGAEVTAVLAGYAAEEGGLQAGDLVTAYDGKRVEEADALHGYVNAAAQGDVATLTVIRDGAAQDITVTLSQLR